MNKEHIIIKTSPFFYLPVVFIGLFFCFSNKDLIWLGTLLIIYAMFVASKSIEIINTDAKYRSWFTRESIKNMESIRCSGISIWNEVIITGRGSSKIKMKYVANFGQIRKLTEEIENLKNY